ncbi:MAG TPA: hypothetical protein VN513_06420 [Gemmatimonadales bacterium]|nr:hypothetical protein [Gemmatimonadales bacterium]
MKPKPAWAVVRNNGYLLVWDGRCPVFWSRRVAEHFVTSHGLGQLCRVARAQIAVKEG